MIKERKTTYGIGKNSFSITETEDTETFTFSKGPFSKEQLSDLLGLLAKHLDTEERLDLIADLWCELDKDQMREIWKDVKIFFDWTTKFDMDSTSTITYEKPGHIYYLCDDANDWPNGIQLYDLARHRDTIPYIPPTPTLMASFSIHHEGEEIVDIKMGYDQLLEMAQLINTTVAQWTNDHAEASKE